MYVIILVGCIFFILYWFILLLILCGAIAPQKGRLTMATINFDKVRIALKAIRRIQKRYGEEYEKIYWPEISGQYYVELTDEEEQWLSSVNPANAVPLSPEWQELNSDEQDVVLAMDVRNAFRKFELKKARRRHYTIVAVGYAQYMPNHKGRVVRGGELLKAMFPDSVVEVA